VTAIDPVAQEWRDRFMAICSAIIDDSTEPEQTPIVLQSGGMDSMTITAALLALGHRPRLVSFRLGGIDYPDLYRVERIAKRHGLELDVVAIERRERVLVADIRRALAAGATNKTHIQCWQPVDAMAGHIAELYGPSIVWMGTGGIYDDSRGIAVERGKHGEDAARVMRARTLVRGGHEGSATAFMHKALVDHGHVVAEPYATEPFRSYSLGLDIAEICRPRQKGIALRAFPEFYNGAHLWARNSSLQVGAGIREWHDTLLDSPRYNPEGFARIIAVYRRINNVADRHV